MTEISTLSKVFNQLMLGRTARLNEKLHLCAAKGGEDEDVRDEMLRLIAKGADPNAVSDEGSMLLNAVCEQGLSATADALVEAGANVTRPSEDGTTPLMMAVWAADWKTTQLLLDKGADATARHNGGTDAVYEALHGGSDDARDNPGRQAECLQRLVEHGAILTSEDKNYIYTVRDDFIRVVPELHDAKRLEQAANDGNLAVVNRFLSQNVNPDLPAILGGNSPLYLAAYGGDIPIMTALKQAGADPNRVSTLGRILPLQGAVLNGQREAVKLLLDMGADPKATVEGGDTLDSYAARSRDKGMATFLDNLLRERNDPDVTTGGKVTAMPRIRLKNAAAPA